MIELARYGVYRIRKYEGATEPYDVEKQIGMVDDTIERTVGVCSFTEEQWCEFVMAVHLARSKEVSMPVTCLNCPHSFSADDENGKSFLYCHWLRKMVEDNERCYIPDEAEFFPEIKDTEESE